MEEHLSDEELDKISSQVLDELTRRIPTWTLCAIRYLTLVDLQNKCRTDAIRRNLVKVGKTVAKAGENPAGEITDMERIQMELQPHGRRLESPSGAGERSGRQGRPTLLLVLR